MSLALIPKEPLPYPLILSPDDIASPIDDAERRALFLAWVADGPAHESCVVDEAGACAVAVELAGKPVSLHTQPGIAVVEIRGLGRRQRATANSKAGKVDILGEQVARELAAGAELMRATRDDATAIIESALAGAVLSEGEGTWALRIVHDDGRTADAEDMAYKAACRQLAYHVRLALRMPGLVAARKALPTAVASDIAAHVCSVRTEADIDMAEQEALARYRERATRYEDVLIEAALEAFTIGGERFEGPAALDALDRVPVEAVGQVRAQILGHINRISLRGKAQPPSRRRSG